MSYRAPDVDRRQILKVVGAGLATTSVLTTCSDKADVSTLSEKPPVIGANGRTVLPSSQDLRYTNLYGRMGFCCLR